MGSIDTSSAEAKLSRADRHIAELARMNDEVARRCVESTTSRYDARTGEHVYSVGDVPAVPAEYSPTLVDAVHNLRCVLDHLARAIVVSEMLTPKDGPSGTSFPILAKRPKGPLIKPKPSDEALAVVDMLQPYTDDVPRRTPLWVLSELDNIDKHRQLLAAVVENRGGGWFGPMEPVAWSALRPDSELARFRLEPNEPGQVTDPTFHFAICTRESTVPPIWKFREAHHYIIEIRNHIQWTVLPIVRALGDDR